MTSLTVLAVRPAPETSTFPAEILDCLDAAGHPLRLFRKCSAGRAHDAFGHRGGVHREIVAYRHVLVPRGVGVPRLVAAVIEPDSGEATTLVEYLDGAVRLNQAPPHALVAAARWLGEFHRGGEGLPVPAAIPAYGPDYLTGWLDRAREYGEALAGPLPWLRRLRARPAGYLELLSRRRTVVHGEFFVSNVLWWRDAVWPVDWESVATGPGELDLASLADGCRPGVVAELESAYCAARWPAGEPADFHAVLDAGRLYWALRWLGAKPGWTGAAAESLLAEAERLAVGLELG